MRVGLNNNGLKKHSWISMIAWAESGWAIKKDTHTNQSSLVIGSSCSRNGLENAWWHPRPPTDPVSKSRPGFKSCRLESSHLTMSFVWHSLALNSSTRPMITLEWRLSPPIKHDAGAGLTRKLSRVLPVGRDFRMVAKRNSFRPAQLAVPKKVQGSPKMFYCLLLTVCMCVCGIVVGYVNGFFSIFILNWHYFGKVAIYYAILDAM